MCVQKLHNGGIEKNCHKLNNASRGGSIVWMNLGVY